jgi:formate/nitrite transporter FocA (FNT family)
MLGAKVTMGSLITNLVVVTLGNIVGGAIVIPWLYHNSYLKSNKIKSTN